jgi:fermentation-respiration switch protein FrsA (DUF1100 family)
MLSMSRHNSRRAGAMGFVLFLAAVVEAQPVNAQVTDSVTLRGKAQIVRLYGARGSGDPVIVSSGDGGWIHLAPHVASLLAAKGFFVVGFDAKAYLQGFTSGSTTLRAEDEPGDYRLLCEYAARGSGKKVMLVGVSEGAGLSVLAATNPLTKPLLAGVVGLGLPDLNELGWRWRDALIYVTHGVPREPSFSTAAIVQRVSPIALATIHSTQDEFVPLAEVQRILAGAGEPKKLWVVNASDHRFSDSLPEFGRCLLEALDWVRDNERR